MELIIKLTFLLAVCIFTLNASAATESSPEAEGEELVFNVSDQPNFLDPGRGQRIPAAPVLCTISKTDGVQIAGIDNSEIESFEIRDGYGNTVAILSEEASFVETLFSLKGEYRVIFRLSDRSLAGWIEI